MWWEALPSLAIVGVCLVMPQITGYFTNQIIHGNAYRRLLNNKDADYHFLRDVRVSGVNNPYKQISVPSGNPLTEHQLLPVEGLESIKLDDEDNEKK